MKRPIAKMINKIPCNNVHVEEENPSMHLNIPPMRSIIPHPISRILVHFSSIILYPK